MLCGADCGYESKASLPKNPVRAAIENIEKLLKSESAANYVASWKIYAFLKLKEDLPFYVSDIHSKDGDDTWFAVAISEDAYDKWEEEIEHQHHPQEEHQHYFTNY